MAERNGDTLKVALLIGGAIALYLLYENYMGGNQQIANGSDGTASGGGNFATALANAIAHAEGANPSINNPGDLTAGDVDASNVTGVFNSAGVVTIDTLENGWNALIAKIQNILSGASSVYFPDMTISQLAQTYTGGDNADGWADTVAGDLGVSPDTTLSDAEASYNGQ